MATAEPCVSVKEEEDDGEFFIMRRSTASSQEKQDPEQSITPKSPPIETPLSTPPTTTALAAAIQAVTGNMPNVSAENANQLSTSLPFVPQLCIPLPAFTVSLPQNNVTTVNPEMKFIVVPVHHCWGCRKEFTDVNQFLEHVNKSMCLPSVNTDNAGSETAQPPSDSSTSISGEISPNNASFPVKGPKLVPLKNKEMKTDDRSKTAPSGDSVDSVIEGILREIRKETLRKEAAGRATKFEALEEKKPISGISQNDSNNNTSGTNNGLQLVNSTTTSPEPPVPRKRSRKGEPKSLIKTNIEVSEVKISKDDSETSSALSSIQVKVEPDMEADSADPLSDSNFEIKDLQIVDPMEVDAQHPARLIKAVYSCLECSAEFHTNIGLLRHQSAVHGVQQFPCDVAGCSKVFKNESALSDHKKRVHGPRSFACVHCNAYFTTETYLKAHVKIHMDKKHVCRECNHSFVNKTDLNNHMRVHTGVKPYTCKVCGKAFRHVSGYYTHVRIHTGETPYECEFCHKKFTNASNFQTHRKIHTQDKKFKCEICDKEFIQQSNFTRHKRTHTKERPYECAECGENFSYSTCLKKHLKKDHGIEPLECDECKRTFLNQSSFVRHRTGCQYKDIVKKEAETDSAQFL